MKHNYKKLYLKLVEETKENFIIESMNDMKQKMQNMEEIVENLTNENKILRKSNICISKLANKLMATPSIHNKETRIETIIEIIRDSVELVSDKYNEIKYYQSLSKTIIEKINEFIDSDDLSLEQKEKLINEKITLGTLMYF